MTDELCVECGGELADVSHDEGGEPVRACTTYCVRSKWVDVDTIPPGVALMRYHRELALESVRR